MKKILALLLFPLLAWPAPGAVTQYLMDEPASLFDIGMLRLQKLATWAESHVGYSYTLRDKLKPMSRNISAHYDADVDKIYVTFFAMDESGSEPELEEGCRKALNQLRIVVSKSVPGVFRHSGSADPAEPTALAHTLHDMFELRCYVSGHDSSDGRFWAIQKLDEQDMTIGRWPLRN